MFPLCSGGIEHCQSFFQEKAVPDDLSDARYQVALANRILANEACSMRSAM